MEEVTDNQELSLNTRFYKPERALVPRPISGSRHAQIPSAGVCATDLLVSRPLKQLLHVPVGSLDFLVVVPYAHSIGSPTAVGLMRRVSVNAVQQTGLAELRSK